MYIDNTDVISRYGCNGNLHVYHVDRVYEHKITRLFIDRIDINLMDTEFHRISSELWPSGYNGGLATWRSCGVGGSTPTVDKIS